MIFPTAQAEQSPQSADSALVEQLYGRYADMIYRIAFVRTRSSADSDDVLQEVFLRFIRRAPVFENDEHAKAWFIRTAMNCSNSLLSSAWRRHTQPQGDLLLERMERDTEVYSAVLRLPEKQRTAVHLYYYEGYKVSEIAAMTRAKEATVKSWLFRARETLRRQLGEDFDEAQ